MRGESAEQERAQSRRLAFLSPFLRQDDAQVLWRGICAVGSPSRALLERQAAVRRRRCGNRAQRETERAFRGLTRADCRQRERRDHLRGPCTRKTTCVCRHTLQHTHNARAHTHALWLAQTCTHSLPGTPRHSQAPLPSRQTTHSSFSRTQPARRRFWAEVGAKRSRGGAGSVGGEKKARRRLGGLQKVKTIVTRASHVVTHRTTGRA